MKNISELWVECVKAYCMADEQLERASKVFARQRDPDLKRLAEKKVALYHQILDELHLYFESLV